VPTPRSRRRVLASSAVAAALALTVVGAAGASIDHYGHRHRHHPRSVPSAAPSRPPAPPTTAAPAPSMTHSHTKTNPAYPTATSTTSTTTAAPPSSSPLPKPSGVVFADHAARFNVLCTSDHYAPDDPIVFPGQPGKSHMHTFYGNTSTNAASTIATLSTASPSSCGRGMGTSDLSAYWVPSLIKENADGSTSVVKIHETNFVYYERPGNGRGPGVLPFPVGLRMIAGDAMATSDQSLSVVDWTCGGGGPETPHIHECPGTQSASLHVTLVFPSCWDGTHLDSPNHKSHMAYPAKDYTCPADHPVSLPQMRFEIDYPGIGGGAGYHLASGGIYSFHGDFIANWDNQVQNALVASCLNVPHECADMNRDLIRDPNTLFRPDYDPEPIKIDLKPFSHASPWDGRAVSGPVTSSPMPMPMPTH
jgi:hypothetical protein